jgi:DNA-binding transcriptional regulator YiaG
MERSDLNIKKIRAAAGLTQVEFAGEIGIDPIQVSRWENEVSKPSKLARRQIEEFCRRKRLKLAIK